MSSKRSFSEVDSDAPAEEAPNSYSSNPKKRKFEKKGKGGKGDSINALKKRVRTIERRFKREESLPPNVMAELQRELATHKAVIAEAALRKKRGEMISKYHMVRFFERRKAERLAKQLQRKADESEDPGEKEELRPQIHKAEVDLAYTRYFPFLEPYISLYAQDDDTKSAIETLDAERPPIWKEVEAALKEGEAALENLRERIPEGGVVRVGIRNEGKAKDGKARDGKAEDGKIKDSKIKGGKIKNSEAKQSKIKDDGRVKDSEARQNKYDQDGKATDSMAHDATPRTRKEARAKEDGTAQENPRVRNTEGPRVPVGVRSDGKTGDDEAYDGPPRNRRERRAMERAGKVWKTPEVESGANATKDDVSDGGFFDE